MLFLIALNSFEGYFNMAFLFYEIELAESYFAELGVFTDGRRCLLRVLQFFLQCSCRILFLVLGLSVDSFLFFLGYLVFILIFVVVGSLCVVLVVCSLVVK